MYYSLVSAFYLAWSSDRTVSMWLCNSPPPRPSNNEGLSPLFLFLASALFRVINPPSNRVENKERFSGNLSWNHRKKRRSSHDRVGAEEQFTGEFSAFLLISTFPFLLSVYEKGVKMKRERWTKRSKLGIFVEFLMKSGKKHFFIWRDICSRK